MKMTLSCLLRVALARLIFVWLAVLGSGQARAGIVAVESFDLSPTNSLQNNGGGTAFGWVNKWEGFEFGSVAEGSLPLPAGVERFYPAPTGNRAFFGGLQGNSRRTVDIGGARNLWSAFLVRTHVGFASGSGIGYTVGTDCCGGSFSMSLNASDGKPGWIFQINNNLNSTNIQTEIPFQDQVQLIIINLEFDVDGTRDRMRVWFNADPRVAAPDVAGEGEFGSSSQRIITGANSSNNFGGSTLDLDEIRHGTELTDLLRVDAAPVVLQNATAVHSQDNFPIGGSIDNVATQTSGGWGIDHRANTAVWETATDVILPPDARIRIRLFQLFPNLHTIGRFRISYTSDDRSLFADGLPSGGDVEANWQALRPVSVAAAGVDRFTVLGDDSVLASNGTATTVYEFEAAAPGRVVRGIRLELLEDPSLPANGPGFSGNKNLVLSEIQMETLTVAPVAVKLQNGTASITQGGFSVDATMDGILDVFNNGWAPNHQASTAVWETANDLLLPPNSKIHFKLIQLYPVLNHTIGRFRLSYTADARDLFADGLQNGGDVEANWHVLTPKSITAGNVPEFTVLEDGSVLAGNSTATTIYDFVADSPREAVTGFRLEVLEHPSLPSNGPGFAGNKNLVLTEFQVEAQPAATPVAVALQNATATFSQGGFAVANAIDGVTDAGGNSWAGCCGGARTAVFETKADTGSGDLTRYIFKLFHTDPFPAPAHNLGRFRLSYTTDSRDLFADGLASDGDVSANWVVIDTETATASDGEDFTKLADKSLLVSGGENGRSIYEVSARLAVAGITGFRLEAILDPSLPAGGPGRQPGNGNFHVSEFQVFSQATTPLGVADLTLAPASTNVVTGRAVRFEAAGGVPPFTFSLATNASGGSINGFSGVYVSGPVVNVTDAVRVTDGRGSNVVAVVTVAPDTTPRADLAVTEVLAPATVLPGAPFSISWTVTNQGNAAAIAPWTDFVFVSGDAAAGGDTFLAGFVLTQGIPAGGSLSVTQRVTIPLDGPAGALRFVVATDAAQVVAETVENNNSGVSGADTTIAPTLTLNMPALISEGSAATATVTRNGERGAALEVALSSSASGQVSVPATVTIAAGAASANFNVAAIADGLFDGPQSAMLIAEAAGFTASTNTVIAVDGDVPRLLLTLSTNRVRESDVLGATIVREGPTNVSLAVTLSGGAGQLAFPGIVNIAAGTNRAVILVTATPDTAVERTNLVTFTASANGFAEANANVSVEDDDVPAVAISLSAGNVSEGAGSISGTVAREGISSRALVVGLRSSNADLARVTRTVTIPAGQRSAAFTVNIANDELVNGTRAVLIGGDILETDTGAVVMAISAAALNVIDDDGPGLRLTLSKELVGEGLAVATMATVSRNDAPSGDLLVTLSSSDLTEATVPVSAVIPLGSTSVTFPIASIADGTNDGNVSVTIGATAAGFAPGFATLVVSDKDLPDLAVSNLQAPASGLTGELIDVSFKLENRGFSATGASFVQRVMLSTDALPGDDTLLAQAAAPGALPVGGSFSQTLRVRLPNTPGDYWIVAIADANNQVAEGLEDNNAIATATPVRVGKAYNVTVAANPATAVAGTPITLNGRATRAGSGAAANFEPVKIELSVRDTKRTLAALTDNAGNYSVTFQPLPGEAGVYAVAADHPSVANPAAQTSFTLLGVRAEGIATLRLAEGSSGTNTLFIRNLSNVALDGLAVAQTAGPNNGIALELRLAATAVAGDGAAELTAIITAPAGISGSGVFRVRATSAQGASTDFEIPFVVEALLPRLAVAPTFLEAGMKRGGIASVQFTVTNTGGAASGPVNVFAPALPWLSVASGGQHAPLAPGESMTVTLSLTPPVDLELGDHNGTIAINAGNASASVPFRFRALSDAVGHVHLTAVDELTFYAEGAPVLTNATIRLTDAVSNTETVVTNLNGAKEVLLTNIVESFYRVLVEAPDHAPFNTTIQIIPGATNEVRAFLSRQTVRYTFSVVPITVEDRYEVTIETTFETALPIPIVTAEPTVFDMADLVGDSKQVDVTIRNHGLLAAKHVRFDFPSHPNVAIEPLISEIGDLPAQSSLTIPVTIRRKPPTAPSPLAATAKAKGVTIAREPKPIDPSCSLGGKIEWSVDCGGQQITTTIPLKAINLAKLGVECGSSAQAFAVELGPVFFGSTESCTGNNCGGGLPTYGVPVSFAKQSVCDPCVNQILSGLINNCVILIPIPETPTSSDSPIPLPPDLADHLDEFGGIGFDAPDPECGDGAAEVEQFIACMQAAHKQLKGAYDEANDVQEKVDEIFGNGGGPDDGGGDDGPPGGGDDEGGEGDNGFKKVGKGIDAVGKGLKIARCLSPLFNQCIFAGGAGGGGGGGSGGGGDGGFGNSLLPGAVGKKLFRVAPDGGDVSNPVAPLLLRGEQVLAYFGYFTNLYGSEVWVQPVNYRTWSNWIGAYNESMTLASDGGFRITDAERASLLALEIPLPATAADAVKLIERWNRTLDYFRAGIRNLTEVPSGQSTDFIAADERSRAYKAARNALKAVTVDGFDDVVEAFEQTRRQLITQLSRVTGGICAKVKLRLEQEAVLTRDGFLATLQIENATGTPLEEVSVELNVEDGAGASTTSLFQIRDPELSGITGVTGTGIVPAGVTGQSSWTIIPSSEAAPRVAASHFVSGTLRYKQDGQVVTIPLERTLINVLPSPKLAIDYFHERDVFSDDPFTPEIEPAIPYSLAVRVRNDGFGAARNFRITSAQPEIVDNEKGLFINFEIIATEVGGANLTPALTANFGDIDAGATKVGRWIFRSSLQGLFTDYNASFEHVSGLGDKRFSLIDSLNIHEMIHQVRAGGAFEDGAPDFLVNDVPDLAHLPDTLYFSQGTNAPVAPVVVGTFDGPVTANHLTVQMTAATRNGWVYYRVADPGDASFRLVEVRRADNSLVTLDANVWRTDRTFIGLGQRPIRENTLHILDFQSTGVYTLVYALTAGAADTTAPASAVTALPAASPLNFNLTWSGEDEAGGSGIAFFDVFVSANGGPFVNFLSRTTARGALFQGALNTAYTFFTRAIDAAGNIEAAPENPDAQTSTSLINTAPTITLAERVEVNEGETVAITALANDADLPAQALTFSLVSGPAGVVVDAATGLITLQTSEGSGPSTNVIVVAVSDNGAPVLSASAAVTLVIREVNSAPVLQAIAARTIAELETLSFNAIATDADLPANALTFSLGAGAPEGATITTAGAFTWKPNAIQGPSTNTLRIIVSDNGTPSLSAAQELVVVVQDSSRDFALSLGSTNVVTGEAGNVPIRLDSGLPVDVLEFRLKARSDLVGGFSLANFAPDVLGATIVPLNATDSRVQFQLAAGTSIQTERTLGRLAFAARANGPSGVAALEIENASAHLTDGSVLTAPTVKAGVVFVIDEEPLLQATLPDTIVAYGNPGSTWVLEGSSNIAAENWEFVQTITFVERFVELEIPFGEGRTFYRLKAQ